MYRPEEAGRILATVLCQELDPLEKSEVAIVVTVIIVCIQLLFGPENTRDGGKNKMI